MTWLTQVVSVGEEVFVKIIDIDMDRRRISLSLKQANEGVDPNATEFDPALYGMAAEYDEAGNYKYPEGFDPEANECWKASTHSARLGKHSTQRHRLASRLTRFRFAKALEADAEAAAAAPAAAEPAPTSYSSEEPASAGTLASDEALAELRKKLTGN